MHRILFALDALLIGRHFKEYFTRLPKPGHQFARGIFANIPWKNPRLCRVPCLNGREYLTFADFVCHSFNVLSTQIISKAILILINELLGIGTSNADFSNMPSFCNCFTPKQFDLL